MLIFATALLALLLIFAATNFLTSLWVDALTGSAVSYGESAETNELNALVLLNTFFNSFKNGFDSTLSSGF